MGYEAFTVFDFSIVYSRAVEQAAGSRRGFHAVTKACGVWYFSTRTFLSDVAADRNVCAPAMLYNSD